MNIFDAPFRVGTTSYIIPDEILPNVRWLAGRVRDVELVLFELDEGPSNLPDTALVHTLNQIAGQSGLSYTVHLPLDLQLGAQGDEQHISLVKARRVIEATLGLNPWVYVLHLEGSEHRQNPSVPAYQGWVEQACRALELAAGWAGGFERLAVENLDSYPPDFIEPVLSRSPAGRCLDIGHLWKDGHDPLPYLERALPRTRVMHLHGIGERDHQSLKHTPAAQLDAVVNRLVERNYRGVLTLEIFSEHDFMESLAALSASLERVTGGA